MCFRKIISRDVLEAKIIKYNSLNNEVILKLLEQDQPNYNLNELQGQIEYFQDETEQYIRKWGTGHEEIHCLDIFNMIFAYVSNLLTVKDDSVCCQYEKLLHWRMLTLDVHEDLLICAFLANHDSIENMPVRTIFDWPDVIGHNNADLNMILRRGMAENHFHLKGSAPAFHFAWNYFMNNLISNDDESLFEKIEKTQRNSTYSVSSLHREDSLKDQIIQAAAIRAYLFSRLLSISLGENEDTIIKFFNTNANVLQLQNKTDKIRSFIQGLRVSLLHKGIDLLKDYAVIEKNIYGEYVTYDNLNTNPENSEVYRGERHFLYLTFQDIKEKHILTEAEINLFFAYLIIKERFRGEIQQLNQGISGFENFAIFEGRKGYFVDNRDLVHDAMMSPMNHSGIRYLEARICPANSAEENKNLILQTEAFIDAPNNSDVYSSFSYAYIMHFVKEEDNSLQFINKSGIPDGFICRHNKLRRKLDIQAEALVQFRESYPEISKKVVAIDACNKEICCRPEVFAPIFRRLRKHTVKRINKDLNLDVPQLRTTYHVGEEFLDPLDGLRAIDEAINFIGLGCGDRLGHALALGIDVEEWYMKKTYIIIPCQDYLDNITWLYFALSDYNITGFETLKTHLLDEFYIYFNRIFRSNMLSKDIRQISETAEEYYSNHIRFQYLLGGQMKFDIHSYHMSWKLRGDDPEYYKNGFFEYSITNDYRKYPHKICENYPSDFNTRMISEVAMLNYYYHYDWNVKKAGSKFITKKVHPEYVKAVSIIQKKLQKKVANYGIGIETNPTSNYLIGTFKRYDKHPITKWYNHGLETNPLKIADCPQISVSINTDDKGVFTTRLDNEYSLIALSLEKMRDENNNPIYEKNNIYKWIDSIRRFGIMQSFICQNMRERGEPVTEDL